MNQSCTNYLGLSSLNKSQNKQQMANDIKQLFLDDKQNFMIIWGDKNDNPDNRHVKTQLVDRYPFLKDRIIQCLTSQEFRDKAVGCQKKNVIFMMSGSFATEVFHFTQNIAWISEMISEQKVHSKAIILFTSKSTIQKNNWTIENLQTKYPFVTQLTIDYEPLLHSFDQMIFNRIHRSFEQAKNLDLYFGAQTDLMLSYFSCSNKQNIKELRPSTNQLDSELSKLCAYIKSAGMKTPIVLHMSDKSIQEFYDFFENCFKKSYKDEKITNLTEQQIVENVLNLYTKETSIYRILNFSLNTMNPIIYNHMSSIYKLFSACLYLFEDNKKQEELTLQKGAVIQKYQYDNIYKEFQTNNKKNTPTFIVFPQFLSTSLSKQIASRILQIRQNEVTQQTNARVKIEIPNQFITEENKQYMKSNLFSKNYQVLMKINVNLNINNKFRPKYIASVSKFQPEEEYLFQPYQLFKIVRMEQQNDQDCSLELNYELL